MNKHVNANYILRTAVSRKWGWDEETSPGSDGRKEWWYQKLAAVRRTKLLRCSEQQNHRCCYCGRHTWHPAYGETGPSRLMSTLEHIKTRSEGGTDNMNNLAMACSRCNNGRSDRFDPVEYYEMIIGLREYPKTLKEISAEKLAEKAANKAARTEKLVWETAALLCFLNLWDWWDSWLTYSLPMLEYE